MDTHVPVRPAEGSIIGEAGGRAAGSKGLQGPRHIVAIQRRDARSSGAIRIRRAGRRWPRDIVARRGRARAARRRGNHGDRARRHVVALVRVAAAVVDGIPHAVAGVSSCAGKERERR